MDTILPTLDGYTQRLMGAHRKPVARVGAPALVLHLGVWKPLDFRARHDAARNGAGGANAPEERMERRLLIDQYLHNLYLHLNRLKNADALSELSTSNGARIEGDPNDYVVLFQNIIRADTGDIVEDEAIAKNIRVSSEYQTIIFEFRWHGLPSTIRVELHTEYFTISSYIDLSEKFPGDAFKKFLAEEHRFAERKRPLANIIEEMASFERLVQQNTASLKSEDYSAEHFRKDFAPVHSYLYHEVWQQFIDGIIRTKDFVDGRYGKVFADFRAVILGANGEEDEAAFRPPFHSTKGKPRWSNVHTIEPGWDVQQVRKFWPFLTCEAGVPFKKYEFTATSMLGGRALYLTSLGAQPSDLPREGRFPLLYFLSTTSESRWQIGRLVDRINDLGTVRLAALMKLDTLHDAGFMLRDIEELISGAKESVQRISSNHALGNATHIQNNVDELSQYLDRIETAFENIDQIGDDPEIGRNPIDYRLDRARYYIRQFRANIAALRLERVEGFQPYDNFVERRLGSAFDFITRLSARVDRVRRDREALLQYYLAQSAAVIGVNIETTNDKIHTLNERLMTMQGIAEFALFAVIFPYYSVSLIDHFFNGWSFVEDGSVFNKVLIALIIAVCWTQAYDSFQRHLAKTDVARQWIESAKTVRRASVSAETLALAELVVVWGGLIWALVAWWSR